MKLTNKLFRISLLLFVSFVLVMSCSDSPTSSEKDDNNEERITDRPISELPGDEDESVVNATYDLSAPSEATEEQVSTIEEEAVEQRILRTEIEILVSFNTTTGQINDLLKKYDAEIVDMLEGQNYLILQISDPGNMELLQEVIDKLKSEDIIENVIKSLIFDIDRLESSGNQTKIPDHIEEGDYDVMKHQTSIRAHGAWNLNKIINEGEKTPWLIITDGFGNGEPGLGFNIDVERDDFGTKYASDHGYKVLGIIAGSHIEQSNISDSANNVLGVFSKNIRLRVQDISKINEDEDMPWNRIINRTYRLVKKVHDNNKSANIILNTSLGDPGIDYNDYAYTWIEKVRGSSNAENLEDKFIHFTAAGNWKTGETRFTSLKNSPFTHAGLKEATKENLFGSPDVETKLSNIFVVENRVPLKNAKSRHLPGCTYIESMISGTISAIGTDAWTLTGPGNQSIPFPANGTSMSSPQAAGVAALAWSVNPDLSVKELKQLIISTAEEITIKNSSRYNCLNEVGQPVVDAYAAVLAAGGDNARKTLLDVDEDGAFDEEDIEEFLSQFEEKNGELEYGRYDLNGSGQTGGNSIERFDLNDDIQFGTVSKTIHDNEIEFNEKELTDHEILCYYSYSDLFEGDEQARDELLEGICYESFSEPTVITNQIENITSNSADVGGEVTDNGGKQVTTRGVCFSTSEDPTTNDECTSNGEGTGRFSSTLSNLNPDTEYFVRAFATNSEGTAYGEQEDFVTTEESQIGFLLDPTDLLIEPGSSQTTEATVSRTNFEGEVTLSVVSSLPSGVTAEIDQPGSGDTGSVEFLLDVGHETFEDYEVEIQASGEGVNSVVDEVYLNIERVGELSLSMDPTDLLIEPGSSQTTEATVSRTNFEGEVTLSVVSSLPSGVTAEIDQPGNGDSGSVEFLLDEGHETFEDYEVEIQASGEGVKSVRDGVYLNIERVGELSLSMDPTDLLIEPGSSQTTEATVSRTNFEGEITLSVVSSLPSGVTAEIDQPGSGDTGSVEFLLDEDHGTFEDYEVEIQASGEDVKSVRDEVYLNIEEQVSKPSVTTESVSSITTNSAKSGGDVTDDGGADVTERGVCWDTSEDPTLDDQCTINGQGSGDFESEITELNPDTRYYVKAYATNSEGTSYGNQQDFRTEDVQTYSIFGVVAEDDGTSIEGLAMLLIRHDQDSNLSTSTDNSGYYIFENLRAGDDYSVAPQSTDEFEPTNQRFDNLSSNQSQDFVRVPETYSISGTVFDSEGQGIEDLDMLLIRHDQDSNISTTTDSSGDYMFEELRAGDDYTVAPQSTDEFEPTNQRFDNVQSHQTQDFEKVEEDNNDCPSDTETEVVEVTSPETGRTWMDRNLGACRAANSSSDEQAYGDLYQWGRLADGHEKRNSGTTTTLSSTDQPGHGNFIITSEDPNDWRSPQNDDLWNGTNGINNPCPKGYRIPTSAEFRAEIRSWSTNDKDGAFTSPLKLPLSGFRDRSAGSTGLDGIQGFYWTSIEDRIYAQMLVFDNDFAIIGANPRGTGFSVRCIKD